MRALRVGGEGEGTEVVPQRGFQSGLFALVAAAAARISAGRIPDELACLRGVGWSDRCERGRVWAVGADNLECVPRACLDASVARLDASCVCSGTSEAQLQELFAPFGPILRVDVKRDIAFVHYSSEDGAARAVEGTASLGCCGAFGGG
jgi:hypothetical protein